MEGYTKIVTGEELVEGESVYLVTRDVLVVVDEELDADGELNVFSEEYGYEYVKPSDLLAYESEVSTKVTRSQDDGVAYDEPESTYIISDGSITLTVGMVTVVATSDNPNYMQCVTETLSGNYTVALGLIAPAAGIENWGQGLLSISEGEVVYAGMSLTGDLTTRIVTMMKEGDKSFERFAKFLSLAMEQPSFKTRERIMDFVANDQIVINEEGFIIAFKNVREDYMDKHSGTFRNMVGDEPSMPRHMVDDNHDNTCSAGLHVASPSYMKEFWGKSGKNMRVSVDPRDLVSVPYDYANSKARVSKYLVVEDITGNEGAYGF